MARCKCGADLPKNITVGGPSLPPRCPGCYRDLSSVYQMAEEIVSPRVVEARRFELTLSLAAMASGDVV